MVPGTHPSVAAALSRSELKLHGWIYKFETGEVFAFNPDWGQFVSLEKSVRPAVESLLRAPRI